MIEVVPYWLPFKEPYVTARGRLTRREMVLLRIRDADEKEAVFRQLVGDLSLLREAAPAPR